MEKKFSSSKGLSKSLMFEWVVRRILEEQYVVNTVDQTLNGFDLKTVDNINIEIKYTTRSNLLSFVNSLKFFIETHPNYALERIIFITSSICEDVFSNQNKSDEVKPLNIISLENLIYLCKDNDNLLSELKMCLNFSTENIKPIPLDENVEKLLQPSKKENFKKVENIDYYNKLISIPHGRNHFSQYEKFCEDFIKTIFQDNIEDPIPQKINNQGLYRFDLVAALKSEAKSFWKFIYDKYNSCFILFDCKNYTGTIEQEEIYSTERYLYNNALRNVGIILSRKGASLHAKIACQGILKEHGKLILVLDDNDMKELEILYKNNKKGIDYPTPSDFLFDKAKDFLLNLDK